jgi:hypothetical protein
MEKTQYINNQENTISVIKYVKPRLHVLLAEDSEAGVGVLSLSPLAIPQFLPITTPL